MTMMRMCALAAVAGVGCMTAAAQLPGACGKDYIEYKVKTEKKATMPGAPAAGMAQVIFIETMSAGFPAGPTVRFGADGGWLGANKGNSFFAVSVPAGSHEFCASRQSGAKVDKANVATVKLQVAEGSTTYIELHLERTEVGNAAMNGGAALPGQYPGSMTAKDKPTMDTVKFLELSSADAKAKLPALAMSVATTH